MANYISRHTGEQIDDAVAKVRSGDVGGKVEVDKTLTQEGKAADAKVVGDRFTSLYEEMVNVTTISGLHPAISVEGSYVKNNGSIGVSNGFAIYKPIALSAGDVIQFTACGYQSIVAVLSFTDRNGSFYTPLIVPEEGGVRTFEHVVEQDGFYAFSTYIGTAGVVYSVKYAKPMQYLLGEISELYGGTFDEVISVAYTYDGYVHSGGYLSTHAAYQVSEVLALHEGDTITFDSAVPDASVVLVLSEWNEDGSKFVRGLVSGTKEVQSVKHVATKPIEYLRITRSENSAYPKVDEVTISRTTKKITERVSAIENKLASAYAYDCFPFIRVGVIGDSLASGCSNFTATSGTSTSADRPEYSWGKFMERGHGVEVELFAQGGTSTQTWLTRSTGLAAMQAAEHCDCYIIGLGVNDNYLLGMDYLGTSADVTVGGENGNADSFYGNYSKIIASLLAKSPRCKIFCLTMPSAQGETAIAFNVAIRDLVGMYDNAHLIDLENDEFFDDVQYKSTWNVAHSTAPGYKIIAEHLWKLMNDYIMANVSSFTDVQWILEDHT